MAGSQDHSSYDEVPYLVRSYPQSYPDRLATLALLLGISPPPVDRCRVLELGCASGNNLIPMAEALPQSEFVGIDLSARQIGEGQAAVAELGLSNVTLQHLNILEVDAGFGQFDYIIAHGIYSWVPEVVRDHILTICQQNLAPNGIAYVSYNTYPGWRVLGIIRDMLLYHTTGISDPSERAARSLGLLEFVCNSMAEYTDMETPIAKAATFMKQKLENLGLDGVPFLLHDLMEEVNEPCYFFQFAERASRHGLQYLSEAELADVMLSYFPRPVAETIGAMSHNLIDTEQYMDFMRNRSFRQTLLCHQDLPIDRTLSPEPVKALHAASRARPVAEHPDIRSVSVERFRSINKAAIATEHPVSKAAMVHLGDVWPRAVSIEELLAAAYRRLDIVPAPEERARDEYVLCSTLLQAYTYSPELVGLHTCAPRVAPEVSNRPVARPVARFQARHQAEVTNLYHEVVHLDELSRSLLPLLDGSRDRGALLDDVTTLVADGTLVMPDDVRPADAAATREFLEHELSQTLTFLANAGLLIG